MKRSVVLVLGIALAGAGAEASARRRGERATMPAVAAPASIPARASSPSRASMPAPASMPVPASIPAPASPIDLDPTPARLSSMGNTDGDAAFDGAQPAVAYNATDDEFLVVWRGNDDGTAGLDGAEVEVFGQRIDGTTHAEVGADDFLISAVGGTGTANGREAVGAPAVAWSSTSNVYLVVWSGDDSGAGLADDELEVFGQCLNGSTGVAIGASFRISDMGPDGNAAFDAIDPDVAYNVTSNEFLVVWSGDDDTGGLVDDEFEIFAQRVSALICLPVGANDVRVSAMQPAGANFDANTPAVAASSSDGNYLVVWSGDQFILGSHVDEDFEIHGQLLTAAAAETGPDDFRLSKLGNDGVTEGTSFDPDVAYNTVVDEYLVAWSGDWTMATVVDTKKFDIHAQRITAAGAEVGPDDARITLAGGSNSEAQDALTPAVAYSPTENTYLVAYVADGRGVSGQPADDELEVHLQPIAVTGDDEFYLYDRRLTHVGDDGVAARDAAYPAIAFGAAAGRYLLVWDADDSDFGSPALVADEEFEIFAVDVRIPGFYVLDSWGGIHSAYGPALAGPATFYFGFDIARDFEIVAGGYYVLDGFGGLHPGGGATPIIPGPPFFGFDVARDAAAAPSGGAYVLDGFGGVHAAGGAPVMVPATPYFGFDIARDLELVPSGGYVVLEGFGGVHSGGGANVPFTTFYWGFDRGRDIELAPVGYYVMHDRGGLLAGNGAPAMSGVALAPLAFARDFELVPGGALILDENGTVYAVLLGLGGQEDAVVVPAPGFVQGAAAALELR